MNKPVLNPQSSTPALGAGASVLNQQFTLLALLLASFALRLHALLQLPGFVDEGNHLLWAVEVWQGRIIFPFSTAKPLEIFYLAVLMPFRAPLWVGRFGSVLASVVTMAGLWALARRWGDGRAGMWAVAFYTLMPWTFFHERTAVADPLLAANVVLLAWAVAAWAGEQRKNKEIRHWRLELLLTACLFALPLIKLSAASFAALPVVIVALRNRAALRRLWLPYLIAICAVAAILFPAALRYDVFGEITLRASAGQKIGWVDSTLRNLGDLFQWSAAYLGWVALLILLGAFVSAARRSRVGMIALAGCLLGVSYIVFPSTAFPRYYLPALAFASLLAAEAAQSVLRLFGVRWLRWSAGAAILFAIALPFAVFALQAYHNPAGLRLAEVDRAQHVTDWSSGYGIREAAAFASEMSYREPQPIVYAGDLSTRVVAWLYWPPDSPGQLYTLWDGFAPDVIRIVASGRPTYLIVDATRGVADFTGLTINPHEIARFERPPGGAPVVVYRLANEPYQP